jgi:FkbM family methyltransferase
MNICRERKFMSNIKKLIPSFMLPFIRKLLGKGDEAVYVRSHYSQCGEDIVLTQLNFAIGLPERGFYIDVGAYHPFEGSNTFVLHQKGWRGVNIDPNPHCKPLFDKYRPNDINLSCGISKTGGMMKYYMLDSASSMNTFSKENLESFEMLNQVTKTIEVETKPLSVIIKEHVPRDATIDFLNIDAEGYEMEVLNSIEWNYKQPKIIALEQNNVFSMEEVLKSDAYFFLNHLDYTPVSKNLVTKTVSTIFYIKKDS